MITLLSHFSLIRHLQLKDSTLSQVLVAKEQQHRPSHAVTNGYGIYTGKLFQMCDQLEVSQGITLSLLLFASTNFSEIGKSHV